MDQYKYNIYSTGEEQLFNLQTDPGEMHNLIGKNEFQAIRLACRDRLRDWAQSTEDTFGLAVLSD
jgi:hypothetical protein